MRIVTNKSGYKYKIHVKIEEVKNKISIAQH